MLLNGKDPQHQKALVRGPALLSAYSCGVEAEVEKWKRWLEPAFNITSLILHESGPWSVGLSQTYSFKQAPTPTPPFFVSE